MALRWEWSNKCGTMEFNEGEVSLYEGNAFLIMIWENETQYQVIGFFLDESHAKRCLGLTKNMDGEKRNIYAGQIKRIVLYTDKCRHYGKIAELFTKADPNIIMELRKEADDNDGK